MATNEENLQEQQYEVDPSEIPQEEQEGEEFLADILGFDDEEKEETPSTPAEQEEVAEEPEEATDTEIEEEEEEDSGEEAPAAFRKEVPPKEQAVEGESQSEYADLDAVAERNPEFKAIMESEARLRKMLSERDKLLSELIREREQAQITEEKFISEEDDLDRILTDPAAFNALLNKVYRKGVYSGKEQTLKSFDSELDNRVRLHLDRRARAENFFKDNPELSTPKLREYVFIVGQELAENHPDWDIDTFYSHLGPEVKGRLGLAAVKRAAGGKQQPVARASGNPGGLNKGVTTRPPKKSKTRSLADEVAEDLGI